MQYIIMRLLGNIYDAAEYSDDFSSLANFLAYDVVFDGTFFNEWVHSEYLETEGNYSWLEKWDNNILIGCLFDQGEGKYKYAFSIHKNEFLKILELWQEICKQKHNEIHITYENGKITMEGKN